MSERILGMLDPVRRRQRASLILRAAVVGLLSGSLASLAAGLFRWGSPGQAVLAPALALLVAGPLFGMIFGLLRSGGWGSAAAVVDAHYRLKDRALTAVDFVRRAEPTPVHELQLDDAE